jgi:hypothetical protein
MVHSKGLPTPSDAALDLVAIRTPVASFFENLLTFRNPTGIMERCRDRPANRSPSYGKEGEPWCDATSK